MNYWIVWELFYMDNSLVIFWNDHLFSDMFTSYFLKFTGQFYKRRSLFRKWHSKREKNCYLFFTKHKQGDFFLCTYCIQHCIICRPSNSTVSEDAGIEPRTVAPTSSLAVRRFNHSATSHPPQNIIIIIMFAWAGVCGPGQSLPHLLLEPGLLQDQFWANHHRAAAQWCRSGTFLKPDTSAPGTNIILILV